MKKKKRDISKILADELQLPQTSLSDIFRIEFRGNTDVTVEGCKGIVEYDDNSVSINLGKTFLRFRGSDLEIKTYSEEQAVISGTIITMEFSS